MKLKQSVNLLLIALFVWAFQSSTIHFHHHTLDQISECNLCHSSQKFDLSHRNGSVVTVNENLAVKTRERVEKVLVKLRFDYTDVPKQATVHSVENQQYSVEPIPIGFNATAPPYLVS